MNGVLASARHRAPTLVAATGMMLVILLVSLGGLMLDDRIITGAPAWLKPAKFSVSVAIFTATMAWLLTLLPEERGLRRAGITMAVLLILEVALIVAQVLRGRGSHFNVSTVFDGMVFRVMGIMIAAVMFASMYVFWRLVRTPLADRGLASALRWGLAITVVGGWIGAVMTVPNRPQRERMARGEQVVIQGGHAVGAPDGGPGIPLVRWSATAGDLRVAHFFGLHGMQLMPLALLVLRRQPRSPERERRIVWVIGLAYFALVTFTLLQALAGRPFIPFAGS